MAKRITEEECEKLYQQYHTPEHVIGHCRAVSQVAVEIGRKLNEHGYRLDLDLIKGAGLAHDVARVSERHWDAGADILEELGYEDEAKIVRVHMTYDFHQFPDLDETDLVCLGDRLVKEHAYVGLDERIDYIIHKAGDDPVRTAKILEKKAETRKVMDGIEALIGQTIDSLFQEER
jgi:hypothetical protein